jgi:hypothetical protein
MHLFFKEKLTMDNNGFGEAFAIQIAFFFCVSLIHERLLFFQTRSSSNITRQARMAE